MGLNARIAAFAIMSTLAAHAASAQTPPPPRASGDPAVAAFRNSADAAPPGWTGRVFQLSREYPTQKPDCFAPWLALPVAFDSPTPNWAQWSAYTQTMLDYAFLGQDPNLPDETGWKAQIDGFTRWFHVPWMAYDGERGREFVHGLTNERSTPLSAFTGGVSIHGRGVGTNALLALKRRPGEPVPVASTLYETWSVGMYNPCGAWSIGQIVPPTGVPATYQDGIGANRARGLPFEAGTMVVKILNTTATANDVPYLRGSTTWQANTHTRITPTTFQTCQRSLTNVHLVQMDIAVVDPRSPSGWVYTTFMYDGTLSGATVKDRMTPLGVQWGNDSTTFPAVPQAQSVPVRQTVMAPINIPEHNGCNGRLAGVADNPQSSCLSCHLGAFAPANGALAVPGTNVPNIFSFPDNTMCTTANAENQNYFATYRYPQPFPSGQFNSAIPLDTSLQVTVAFDEYAAFINQPLTPPACPPAGQ